MILGAKIGCGITTYRRLEQLTRLCESLPQDVVDALIIVNDDPSTPLPRRLGRAHVINNSSNLGVGKSKNLALRWLLGQGAEHLFLFEDDVFIRDPKVFLRYIRAGQLSGIQHFNHGPIGPTPLNTRADGVGAPNLRLELEEGQGIDCYPSPVAAMSYFTRLCLETVGLYDEDFYNAHEHIDHTLRIISHGMHPPYGFFADIADSQRYLGGDDWSVQQSTIPKTGDRFAITAVADKVFMAKHGMLIGDIRHVGIHETLRALAAIRQKFGQVSVTA